MTTLTNTTGLYFSGTLRQIEQMHQGEPLMRRAGIAAAEWATTLVSPSSGPVLILAGPGNNGGDALEMAYELKKRQFEVDVILPTPPHQLPPDAAQAYQRFTAADGLTQDRLPQERNWSLIVDGLFGIGLTRPPKGYYSTLIHSANVLAQKLNIPLLALDCPSGLDVNTGFCPGAAICASHTITFVAGKPGLFTAEGPDHCGITQVHTLALPQPPEINPDGQLVTLESFRHYLRPRRYNSHKGTHGSVGVIGGAHSMLGATLLSGRAALKLGSGRVFLGLLDPHAPGVDPLFPELMLRRREGFFDTELDALACGPGLGRSVQAEEMVEQAVSTSLPLVLDADALNILAFDPALQTQVQKRSAPVLLTPHPAEAGRLLDLGTADIQQDRIRMAQEIARRYGAWVALKGCGTIIAAPEGNWWINRTGNPGLATAGSGDVLTGMVVALLGQRWGPLEALQGACYLHGAAADQLVAQGMGPTGLCAGELIDAARYCLNRCLDNSYSPSSVKESSCASG